MDLTLFQDRIPGQLVPIERGWSAFLPHPLPIPDFTPGEEVRDLLAEAREAVGELRGKTSAALLPNPGVLLRPLQRQESIRSSSLEGTFVSPEELLDFELRKGEREGASDDLDRWREVFNYDLALQEGEALVERHRFSQWLIRALHQRLLGGVRGDDKSPGQYRTGQVVIGSNARFIPPPGHFVSECMDALERYCASPDDQLHPLLRSFIIHYQFETIHPFRDGNGRVGRLLLALMHARWLNFDRPWLYMSGYFERHKGEYIDRLFAVSARAAWDEWLAFCLRGVVVAASETAERCAALIALRNEWESRIHQSPGASSTRLFQLIRHLVGNPIISPKQAREITGSSPTTAGKDLEELASLGILTGPRGTRPKSYIAMEVLRIAHGAPGDGGY